MRRKTRTHRSGGGGILGPVIMLVLALPAAADDGYGPLVRSGLDEQIAIGGDLFFNETFAGNGRTCSTCHVATDNYTLPPDLDEIPIDEVLDPLMVGDPDNVAHVPELELCSQTNPTENCQAIRQSGLILVNADGDRQGLGSARSYSMRSIPHMFSLSRTIASAPGQPVSNTGWSGDGAPGDGSLRQFAVGAVQQHFTRDTRRDPDLGDFRNPTDAELDALLAFQLELGRKNEINLNSVALFDANAELGKLTFDDRCASCHANAGAISGGVNANFDTHVEEARIGSCNPPNPPGRCAVDSVLLVPGANHDGGFGVDAIGDGRWGDGTFNTPSLIEAADTPPFFHDNAAQSIEDAVLFYRTGSFLDSPSCDGIREMCGLNNLPLGPTEAELGAMLRLLNAGFNVNMAGQRMSAVLDLLNTESGTDPVVAQMLELAVEEIEDADTAISRRRFGIGLQRIFEDQANIDAARADLQAISGTLDGMIAGGASYSALAVTLTSLIAVAEDHFGPDFYDEGTGRCASRGVTVGSEYHDCRWLFEMGDANLLFDNRGTTPEIVDGQTRLTWQPNPGGTATLTMVWRTAEWSNPLYDRAVLTDISRNPSFNPVTFDSGSVALLANGQFERTYSYTVPCVPNAKYRLDVESRVGGVTETDSDTAKALRYCIAFPW